jgi:hypothetical protein
MVKSNAAVNTLNLDSIIDSSGVAGVKNAFATDVITHITCESNATVTATTSLTSIAAADETPVRRTTAL